MLISLKNFLFTQLAHELPVHQELKIITCLRPVKFYQSKILFYIFTQSSPQPLYIAKIAPNEHTAATLRSAFEMLKDFSISPALSDFAHSVPRPICEGDIHGLPLFVESFCSGRAFPQKKRNLFLNPFRCYDSAVRWIREFHLRTKKIVRGEEEISRLFLTPIEKVITIFPEIRDRLKPVQRLCFSLSATPVPTVYSHGDFRAKNLLFGEGPEDIKVVDWESHKKDYLPLFDLISLSVWFIYRRARLPLFEGIKACFFSNKKVQRVMEDYLSSMEIGEDFKKVLIPAFIIERILHLHRERGKEGVKEHLSALTSWLNFAHP